MVFVILNNLGHWGMLAALLILPGVGLMLVLFSSMMLLGDVIKLVFIRVHRFSVPGVPRPLLYALTAVYIVGYAGILAPEVV
jgi:hypothetical protein